jgi:uroporphyrinogen-III decarboxylase
MFREFALPGIRERVRNIHEQYRLPVMKHACGNNTKLLDMFVEAGYDAYQSIQKSAGMDLAAIKEHYGGHFTPWGGIPVEYLVSGSRDDIRGEVRHAMDVYKRGGGYIFGSTHSIAVGTKYDNFMTMVDEFEKGRAY